MPFTKDLRPSIRTRYNQALNLLQVSNRTRIGHIDTGVAEHAALGYANGQPPAWLRIDEGRDFLASDPAAPPVSDLRIGPTFIDRMTDWPDHGIKTLSVIVSDTHALRGVAPGVEVVPVRIADGPVFQDLAQRGNLGRALELLLTLDPMPRVISISMGNPGWLGLFQPPFSLLGQRPGFDTATRRALDRAYEAGVIVVAAAGQVIDRVTYPARYARTIAVGGYFRNRTALYPPHDYDIPDRVDIWAQAAEINRAYARRRDDGSIERGHAEDEGTAPASISGTSYATPQVAAAAALWVESHFHALPRAPDADAWKTVEAFRAALRASADTAGLEATVPHRRFVTRRCLNIERLLGTAPALPPDGAEATPCVRHTNQA
ncbi:MAG TPA: S8/S53 family peptidase [Thermohalobaculum sp.]|nr:S8/S53 family peptidase [Thermohalobaculum sp.]